MTVDETGVVESGREERDWPRLRTNALRQITDVVEW
jgi:hypothetical protein